MSSLSSSSFPHTRRLHHILRPKSQIPNTPVGAPSTMAGPLISSCPISSGFSTRFRKHSCWPNPTPPPDPPSISPRVSVLYWNINPYLTRPQSTPTSPAMAGVASAARRLYLAVYNWVVFVGWAQVLWHAVAALLEGGHEGVYAAVERPRQFAQTAAVMEILHGILGLVRSPVSATIPQIGSRLVLTWGILWSFPETQSHILVTSLVISWSITEIIRYSFFGMKEALGFAPSWLLWLRYSTFMILYPTGILSEVGLIYIALPYIKLSYLPRTLTHGCNNGDVHTRQRQGHWGCNDIGAAATMTWTRALWRHGHEAALAKTWTRDYGNDDNDTIGAIILYHSRNDDVMVYSKLLNNDLYECNHV